MRLKITENQFNRIKLMIENEDQLSKFKQLCANKAAELDKIYSKVTFESVGDILSMSLNIKEINRVVYNIEDVMYKAKKVMDNLYSENEDMEILISDLTDVVRVKVTSLTMILDNLEKLQDYQEEHNLTAQFSNVKPTEI